MKGERKRKVRKVRENQRETEICYGSEVVPARLITGSLESKEESGVECFVHAAEGRNGETTVEGTNLEGFILTEF
jgi:hypothetical protein